MAIQKLNVNGWDAGWETGAYTNIDEAVANADGQSIATIIPSNVVVLELDPNTSIIVGDRVLGLDVTLRCNVSGAGSGTEGALLVELLINGSAQGAAESTGNLTASYQNILLSSASWDQDFVPSQIDLLQLRVTASRTVGTGTLTWRVDCADVDITYLPSAVPTGAATLAITSEAPLATVSEDSPVRTPSAAATVLAGQAPPLTGRITVPTGSLSVEGAPSYLNPLTVQLQPNAWDNGWPTGLLSNIDEPTTTPDGQTISTNQPNDVTFIGFDDADGLLDATDDVLGIRITARTKRVGATPSNAYVSLNLYIDGVSQGGAGYTQTTDVFQNIQFLPTATNAFSNWLQPWTIAQLATVQVRLEAGNLDPLVDQIVVDGIDVIITYTPQSPLIAQPPTSELGITGAAPALFGEGFVEPLIGTATLAGQAVTIRRTDSALINEAALALTRYTPKAIVNFLPLPLLGTLALTGKTPVKVVDHLASPAAVSLALAGKVPTSDATGDVVALPARVALTLATEAPLAKDVDNEITGPPVGSRVIDGKVPVLDVTTSVFSQPAQAPVTLTGAAPAAVGSQVRAITTATLSLAAQLPSRSLGTPIPVTEVDLTFDSVRPQIGGLNAELTLAAQLPLRIVTHLAVPAAAALTLTGQTPIRVFNDPVPLTGAAQLAGYAPTLSFSTILAPGGPGLISLTVDYSIEIIATPTDILIE